MWCGLFDYLSLYLSLLVLILGLSAVLFNYSDVLAPSSVFLLCSLWFSVCCFTVINSIAFWWFYELAMLPLLLLVFQGSPYLERFVVGCYISGYLLVTSLPLLLILSYLSFIIETCVISCWSNSLASAWIYAISALVFFYEGAAVPVSYMAAHCARRSEENSFYVIERVNYEVSCGGCVLFYWWVV